MVYRLHVFGERTLSICRRFHELALHARRPPRLPGGPPMRSGTRRKRRAQTLPVYCAAHAGRLHGGGDCGVRRDDCQPYGLSRRRLFPLVSGPPTALDRAEAHRASGHGTESTMDAIANSCNVALMEMAEKIGIDNFIRYQHIFGFGEYTGIDLPAEASTASLLYTTDTMTPVDLATNAFGQNFNVTMTQLAAGFSSLINGGYYYEPHVVKQIQDENGNVIETKNPVLLRKTVSTETSELVKTYLQAVMQYGTGKRAQVEGYDIGAKTGTAQKLPRKDGKYLLSYIGYAPQENPEVVIYVVIDEANVDAQDNSSLVLELAKNIMSEAFPYLGITTIEETGESQTQQSGQSFEDTEYSDYDQDYTDDYSNEDGSYVDENYKPDLDSWATSSNID